MGRLRELAIDQGRMMRVLEAEEGTLVLGAMCGGIAMYEVLVELTDEEAEGFRREGISYLTPLALKIVRRPASFAQRRYRGD